MSTRVAHAQSTRHKGGFTLIELLVVIAVIALLISLLLPALRQAREASWAVICSSNQHQYSIGLGAYSNDWKEYYPGPNTSGAFVQTPSGPLLVIRDKTPTTPVSSHDWISPMMGDSAGLSANRAKRTAQLFKRYGCAAARQQSEVFFDTPTADSAEFATVAANEGLGQVSHLSPASFHYFASSAVANKNPYEGTILKSSFSTPVEVFEGFRPRLSMVGVQPSNKIFSADGTRYLPSSLRLDYDIGPDPDIYGSFTDSSPIFVSSTAWGQSPPGGAAARKLSYRHPGNTLRVQYFDGHVARMDQKQAWKDAGPWYPGNSKFKGGSATPESTAFQQVDQILP